MEPTHKNDPPSMDAWLREAKQHPDAGKVGMYLTHNGTVRATPRAKVRQGADAADVTGMLFSYDEAKVAAAVEETFGKRPAKAYIYSLPLGDAVEITIP